MINQLKKHCWLLVILVILITFWSINSFFNFSSLNRYGEKGFHLPMGEFIRQAINEQFFPHWVPYYYGGTPFFANSQNMFFKLFTLISLVTPSLESNFKIETMMSMIIAALSIYFLTIELKIKPKFAIISSVVYLFNAFTLERLPKGGGDEFINAYIWLPLIFLSTIKGITSKNYEKSVLYSILAGITFAMQFNSGYPALFVYTAFLFGLFLLFNVLISVFNKKLIKKVLICGLIITIITIGLSAIKILPLLEFSKYSSLSEPRTFENSRDAYFKIYGLKDLFKPFLFLIDRDLIEVASFDQIAMGIIPFIFLLFSISKIRNKYVLFSLISLITLFMIANGSFLFWILWKWFPGFNRQHHIGRILIIAILPCSILVGFGAQTFFSIIGKKIKILAETKVNSILILIIISLMLFNFGFFTVVQEYNEDHKGRFNIKELIGQNKMMSYLAEERKKDVFRIHNIKTDNLGRPAAIYSLPLKLELIYGAFNVWVPEYLNEYLWTYSRFALYKFLGMLNTKYIYSNEEMNDAQLKLIRKFDECKICREVLGNEEGEDGPYLYYNNYYLPRAYISKNAILIIGDYIEAKKIMYYLMINPNFNPADTVIIMIDKSINDISIDFLKKFKAIVLVKDAIDQNSISKLRVYKSNNGILLPDVLENENKIEEEEINSLLASFNESYQRVEKLDIFDYTPNGYKVITESKEGFMVLSEKFFMFEGWKAKSNSGEYAILRANGINSAIYLNGDEKNIKIGYHSKSFRRGAAISLLTLIVVLTYIVYYFIRSRMNEGV